MDLQVFEELRLHEAALRQLDGYKAAGREWYDRNATFEIDHEIVRYMDPQTGIYKPKGWRGALSISTVFRAPGQERPYEDKFGPDGDLRYKLRGDNLVHHQNTALFYAMEHGLPIVWFEGFEPGKYYAYWPMFLVREGPAEREVTVTAHGPAEFNADVVYPRQDIAIKYALRETKQRLHQARFRAQVMEAYECRCAVCRLAHSPLLDAAHIIPDAESGEPSVSNGLALCKIHHTAYDGNLIGITPKMVVEVRGDILAEKDGPMLLHGLQEFHGRSLMAVPRRRSDKPDPACLEAHYESFLQASHTAVGPTGVV